MRVRPSTSPDFTAEIRLDPDQRAHFNRDGLLTGFVATHDFHHPEGGLNDGLHFLVRRDELPLGVVATSEVWLLHPERQAGRLFSGMEFNIHAGAAVVGHGFITEVLNARLARMMAGNDARFPIIP
jgi:hypothetical protein